MPVAGIVCEYNPFHLGHGWMLQQLREKGMDGIVCVMSGSFVQRGEFAVADKFARAEMAVRCGADVVLELPAPWSAATAEVFALGGVSALARTGVVTHLAFGSECGDAAPLMTLAQALDGADYADILRQKLMQGNKTFAVCRREAAAQLLGEETAALLDTPNNNLGVEYCRALRKLKSDMTPITVPRTGAAHDGAPSDGIASATHIRQLLLAGKREEALAFLPDAAAEILRREIAAGHAPVTMENCSRAVLSHLRRMSEEDFARYAGGSEGLHHRFYQAVRNATDLEALLDDAKTKRYTHARLRRMLLAAYLELDTAAVEPPYLRVLAANERGRKLLRQMRDSGAPVLTKAADVSALGAAAEELLHAEATRYDLYTLAYPQLKNSACGRDYRTSPIML